jgi:chondroitin AC lyase
VHNGTVVTFQTTVGAMSPAEAKTLNGVATTTFLAGSSSGTATIHAFSGGARTGSGNSSTNGVTVRIGAAAAAGTISMSATPSSVSQSGGTVTISAIVFDEGSNPLPGVNVQFAASTGSLSLTMATTDTSGIARTQLNTTQTTIVSAIAGAAKGDVRVEVSAAPFVTIEAPVPASPVAGQPVAITVSTTSGNTSAPRQVATLEVNFGDNTSETRANVTGSVAFTHTYRNAGGYTVTARAVDVAGNTGVASRAIVVGFAPVPTITLTASKVNPAVNETFTMTVNANPSANGPPLQSVVVRTNDGTVLYSSSASGQQQFPVVFTSSGTRTITAVATDVSGQSATASTVIIVP